MIFLRSFLLKQKKSLISIFITISIIVIFCFPAFSETQDTYNLLEDTEEETIKLLPEEMMLTQQLLYGEKGLLRITGIAPLTPEGRQTEMKVRRGMLLAHQVIGYLTLASIIGTAITGQMLYSGQINKSWHTAFVTGTNIGYGLGALLVFNAPPPLISNKSDKWDSVDWHTAFAYIHFAGMVTTNLLGEPAEESDLFKQIHRISGIVTGLALTGSVIAVSIEF